MTKLKWVMRTIAITTAIAPPKEGHAEKSKTFCGKVTTAKIEQTAEKTVMSIKVVDDKNETHTMELPMNNGSFPDVNTAYTYTITHQGNKIETIDRGCVSKDTNKSR